MDSQVVTLGECMSLIFPQEPVTLDKASLLCLDLAGAESNFAIALSRLGHTVRFISRVGADPLGQRIRTTLTNEHVILDSLMIDSVAPTGIFFRECLPDGQRRVYYYRNNSAASRLGPNDLQSEWFTKTKFLHLTGITAALSDSCFEACLKAIELAKAQNALISFDPNFRPKLWNEETARPKLLEICCKSDLLLMSLDDANVMFGYLDERSLILKAVDFGPKVIVLKKSEQGALAFTNNSFVTVPAFPINQVLDPVGAGDGFNAGFISGLLRGWELPESLRLGAHIGALAVTVMGDYGGYPYESQIINYPYH